VNVCMIVKGEKKEDIEILLLVKEIVMKSIFLFSVMLLCCIFVFAGGCGSVPIKASNPGQVIDGCPVDSPDIDRCRIIERQNRVENAVIEKNELIQTNELDYRATVETRSRDLVEQHNLFPKLEDLGIPWNKLLIVYSVGPAKVEKTYKDGENPTEEQNWVEFEAAEITEEVMNAARQIGPINGQLIPLTKPFLLMKEGTGIVFRFKSAGESVSKWECKLSPKQIKNTRGIMGLQVIKLPRLYPFRVDPTRTFPGKVGFASPIPTEKNILEWAEVTDGRSITINDPTKIRFIEWKTGAEYSQPLFGDGVIK